jgi:aspartyl-tRNA(Asn)/glutamyl-tRNA(Gln) amidotransferase subunit B
MTEYGLPRYDADVLTAEKPVADYFEATLSALSENSRKSLKENAKAASNWVMTDVLRVVGERKIAINDFPVAPKRLAAMITLIHDGTISGKIAKDVFDEMLNSRDDPKAIVERKGLLQVSDASTIEKAVDQILSTNRSQVDKYFGGNEKVFGFFVGETMKLMKGKGNPKVVNDVLRQKLEALRN